MRVSTDKIGEFSSLVTNDTVDKVKIELSNGAVFTIEEQFGLLSVRVDGGQLAMFTRTRHTACLGKFRDTLRAVT